MYSFLFFFYINFGPAGPLERELGGVDSFFVFRLWEGAWSSMFLLSFSAEYTGIGYGYIWEERERQRERERERVLDQFLFLEREWDFA